MRCLIRSGIVLALTATVALAGSDVEKQDAAAIAVAGPIGSFAATASAIEDPFPIQRIRATATQLPQILKQPEAGALVYLRRSDFESRVRAAGVFTSDAKASPKLTHSRYRAALVGADLVGSAELDLNCNRPTPQFLPLDSLRLACSHATWSDGREALLGVTSGSGAASVFVNRAGRQTLKFDWSAAGTMEFGERRFELRVPATPSTILDLELPADLRPSAPGDVLLTGPFPAAGDSAKASWRFRFGGRSRLDFSIRPTAVSSTSASSNLSAHYEIAPGQVTGAFEFELRPAKGTVSEWLFTVERGFRVLDVVVNNRLSWTLEAPGQNESRLLHVVLNQPGIGGKIQILAAAPVADASKLGDAPLPMIRPVGAVLDEETLEIKVSPEVKLEKWSFGDFRLIDAQFLPDKTQAITLAGTFLAAGSDRAARQAPTVSVSPAEPVYTTTEQLDWRFDRDRIIARWTLGLHVQRNPLFRLQVRIPPDYAFARASASREDLIASAAAAGNVLTIEFLRPLTAGQSAELMLDFRGPRLSSNQLAFPAFSPNGASGRSGVLGVTIDSHWSIDMRAGAGMYPVGWLDLDSPAAPPGALAAFRYGASGPAGRLTLTPVVPVFSAATTSEMRKTRFAVRVRSGDLSSIVVIESPAGPAARSWSASGEGAAVKSVASASMRDFIRQFGLFAPSGFARLLDLARRQEVNDDRLWLIQLAQPISGEFVLETAASEGPSSRLRMLGASQSEPAATSPSANQEPPPSPPAWSFADLYLVTLVHSSSEAEVVFGGAATAAAAMHLPIQLPAGAAVRSASVGGRWLSRDALQLSPEGELTLPLLAAEATRFEIRYQLPVDSGFASRVRSPAPALPASGPAIRRWWGFGPGVLPILPAWGWSRGKPADVPTLLGPAPPSASLGFVAQSAVEEALIGAVQTAAACGIVLAAFLFLLAWLLFHTGRGRIWVSVVAAIIVAGAAFGPGGPWVQRVFLLPVCIALLLGAAGIILRGRRLAVSAATAALVVCAVESTTPAQPTTPAVVVLLPPDADGAETVVAPKEVLDRLAAATRPSLPGVVVTGADYSATFEETTARVTARIVAQSLGESSETLSLPLSDARLESVTVNGAPAYPVSQKPGVYLVPLAGAVRYDVEVHFSVPLVKAGTEREIKFGAPECPATRLIAELPPTARQIQCLGRLGKQIVADGGNRRVEIEAGAVKTIQLRWREGPGGTAVLKVREACIWDVSERGAELTACYLTRVEQGAVAALRYDLPADLEPIDVSLRPIETNGSAAIKDWVLGAEQRGVRTLRLDLQGPTTERLLVVLMCRLKKATTRQPTLRFPRPLGTGAAAGTDAIYALRVREAGRKTTADAGARVGLVEEPTETLTRDREWVRVLDRRLDNTGALQVFRPAHAQAPEIRPLLGAAIEKPSVSLETSWQLDPQRSVAGGVIHWSGKEASALVEFTIPGVKILEVRGAEVGLWSQNGGRVQVWLRKAATECELDWTGVANLPAAGQQKQNPPPFDESSPHVLDTNLTAQTLRLRAVDGWNVNIERDRDWSTAPASGQTRVWQSNAAAAQPIRVVLTPAAASAAPTAARETSQAPRTSPPSPSALTPSKQAASTAPIAEAAAPEAVAPEWWPPLARLAGWSCVLAIVLLLAVRFPRSTSPEQLALVGCLFGMAVVGNWWLVGLIVWVLARTAWLVEGALLPARDG